MVFAVNLQKKPRCELLKLDVRCCRLIVTVNVVVAQQAGSLHLD